MPEFRDSLKYSEIFSDYFNINSLLSLKMEKFWKSVIIWRSCGQEYNVDLLTRGSFLRNLSTYRAYYRFCAWRMHYTTDNIIIVRWYGSVALDYILFAVIKRLHPQQQQQQHQYMLANVSSWIFHKLVRQRRCLRMPQKCNPLPSLRSIRYATFHTQNDMPI